jgi:hypothetical protein
MGWACTTHVETKIAYTVLVGKSEIRTDHLEDLDMHGRVILKLLLKCGVRE